LGFTSLPAGQKQRDFFMLAWLPGCHNSTGI